MPTTVNERILLNAGDDDDELDIRYERRDRAPDDNRKIGRVTLMLMILNRIIGSGIFFGMYSGIALCTQLEI